MQVITKEEFEYEKGHYFEEITKGALFIHPTDTIYGIGCDATSNKAVSDLREVKSRYARPFSVIAPSKQWIFDNCVINKEAEKWIDKLPGSYTLILKLKNRDCVAEKTNAGLDTLGIRIPDHWLSKCVQELGVPVVTTSANKTGGTFMTSEEDLDNYIKMKIKFMIYEGIKKGRPSTLVDLTKDKTELKKR